MKEQLKTERLSLPETEEVLVLLETQRHIKAVSTITSKTQNPKPFIMPINQENFLTTNKQALRTTQNMPSNHTSNIEHLFKRKK